MSQSLMQSGGSPAIKSVAVAPAKTDQARADRILSNVQKERGGVQAIAACIDRAPGSVQRWLHVPAIHVRPLLKAHDCGWLTRRMVTIALGVSNADKRKAGNLLAIIRATPGGMAVLAQAAGRSLDATRKWKTVPDAFVPLVLREFSDWPGQRRFERVTRTKPACASVWHRKCLKCGEKFSVNSPYVRRCELHRKEC
ncbi:hypothetical protein [Asaia platycodi]|uniref:hypothetical protein n=1 Tax=Asaia platycodi TaxID=610243 RepID=UPI0011DDD8F3|nr:hypothetical protein [Asaia platycodi]